MHWVSGTWAWAKHRATRSTSSTGTPIYLESSRPSTSGRQHRRRTWSLPTNTLPESSNPNCHSNLHPSSSTSSRTSERGLYRVETYTTTLPHLYCVRCDGLRSRDYHYRHFDDPIRFPAVGICSRERTGCMRAKTDPESYAPGGTPLVDICELPDNSAAAEGGIKELGLDYSRSATPVELMRTKSIG
ncbi:hypothetical protein BDV18DRAFT_153058 [Aspergillus unguis]